MSFESAPANTKTVYINHVVQYQDEYGNDKYRVINTESVDTLASNSYTEKSLVGINAGEDKLTKYKIPYTTNSLTIKTLSEEDCETYKDKLKFNLEECLGYTFIDDDAIWDLSLDQVYYSANGADKRDTNLAMASSFTQSVPNSQTMINIFYKGEIIDNTDSPEGGGDETVTVTVEHKLYDKNGTFTRNLDGNGKIKVNDADTYATSINNKVEIYKVSRGSEITVDYNSTNATNTVEYKGYMIDNGSLIEYTSYSDYVTGDNIKITFKYQEKDGDIKKIITKQQWGGVTPDIGGTLTEESTNLWTKCGTTYSLPGNAVDGTTDIRVGIKNVPTYIVAGIRSKDNEIKGKKVTLNIKIKFGTNSTTKTLEVPYYFLYYTITDAGMYKFMNAMVYNSGIGYDTLGSSTFATENNRRTIYPVVATGNFSKKEWYINLDCNLTYEIPSKYNYSDWLEEIRNENSGEQKNYSYPASRYIDYSDGKAYISYNYDYGSNTDLYNYSKSNISTKIDGLKQDSISGQWTISYTLDLFEKEKFEAIDSDGNKKIELSDVNKLHSDTATARSNLVTAAGTLSAAVSNYNDAMDLYNTLYQQYQQYLAVYYSNDCADNTKCNNIDNAISTFSDGFLTADSSHNLNWDYFYNETHLTDTYRRFFRKMYLYLKGDYDYSTIQDNVNNKASDYIYIDQIWCSGYNGSGSCDDFIKEMKNQIQSAYEECKTKVCNFPTAPSYPSASNMVTALNDYNDKRNTLIAAMEREATAIQNFNEAYEIQKLYNEYKNMDNNELAALLNVNLTFSYDSDNLSYAGISLTTTNPYSKIVSRDYGYDFENPTTVKLLADQPYANDTQKTYYTSGISYNEIGNGGWGTSTDTLKNRYTNNEYIIPKIKLNGKRVLAATSTYEIDVRYNSNTGTLIDNTYYKSERNESEDTIYIKEYVYTPNTSYTKEYGASKSNSDTFNVYTPLKVRSSVSQDVVIINQAKEDKKNIYSKPNVVQLNSNFTLNFKTNYGDLTGVPQTYSHSPSDFTSRYRQMYYVKFDKLDLNNVTYINSNGRKVNYGHATQNTWIGPIYGDSLSAMPYLSTGDSGSITDADVEIKYKVVAVAVNAQSDWTYLVLQHLKDKKNLEGIAIASYLENECGDEGDIHAGYYAFTEGSLVVVNRIYDFRITDLADVNWKNVFRLSSSSNVNQHSGISYFAGIRKLNTNNPLIYNEIISRTTEEIGTNPQRILPLGPYKNTNTSYIKAPKMGYRFSFDVKVSGAIDAAYKKKVIITPKFYYISKDGSTFIEDVDLYYKNSKGQYVKIGSSSDAYKLYFKPKDGYRSTIVEDINNLANTTQSLGSLSEITLESKTMTTYSKNSAAITYYGEYKLPNSTIAVKKDGNINTDKLSNGYIGVIFDIVAQETNGTTLSYSKNSQKNSSGFEKNSSQWDFEGYLGITDIGEDYSTKLRLENGLWEIDDATYQNIKGTVMLYDLDDRASDDFN